MSWWQRLHVLLFPPHDTALGPRGERAAATYLRRKGFRIIARGAQRHGLGEADLIAVDGRTVVFVEVKTRRSDGKGSPADAVGLTKQKRLTRFALSYLKRHDLLEKQARFDVVGIIWPADMRRPRIEHIQNAFEPVGRGQLFN